MQARGAGNHMTKPRFSRGNRDANESLITEILKLYGVRYELLPEGFGADILIERAPMFFVEVKNPAQKPSARMLTDKEKELQTYCHEQGIDYFVVERSDQMVDVLASRFVLAVAYEPAA
jgi:hypothetical protein